MGFRNVFKHLFHFSDEQIRFARKNSSLKNSYNLPISRISDFENFVMI